MPPVHFSHQQPSFAQVLGASGFRHYNLKQLNEIGVDRLSNLFKETQINLMGAYKKINFSAKK